MHCHVKAIGALSAHGDQDKLLDWVAHGLSVPKQVIHSRRTGREAESLAKD